MHPVTGHVIGLDGSSPYLFDGTGFARIGPPPEAGLLQLGLQRALNGRDQVVGSYVDAGLPCGYLWDHGNRHDHRACG
jgi:hypothetical protein